MTSVNTPWALCPLGDLVDVLDARRVPVSAKERASRLGNVPYYGASGPVGWIDKPLFDEPLVLLGEDGVQFFDPAKSKSYLIDGPAWVNNHAHVLRARPVIDRKFLNYYLNTADYRGYANGTTRLKLTQAAMRRIPVPVPPVAEQRRIVAILEDQLSRLDAADANLRSGERRIEAWRSAAIQCELWTGDPAEHPVGELLRETMRNGRSDRAVKAAELGTRTLTLTAVTRNQFTDEFTKLTVTPPEVAKGLWLQPGDILVQRANTPELVGTAARYDGPKDWAIFPDLLIRLRPDESAVDGRFLVAALRSEKVHRTLRARAKGLAGSMPKIDQRSIAETTVPVPSLSRQREAVERITEIEVSASAAIAEVQRQRLRSSALRRALLAAAFAGRLTGSTEGMSEAEEMMSA